MGAWPITRRAQSRLNRPRASPMRVPPDQSGTWRGRVGTTSSTPRRARRFVTRVRVVEKRNVSTWSKPRARVCTKWSSMRL